MSSVLKLLALVHNGEIKTYLARHPSYDRMVMLHLLPADGTPEAAAILSVVHSLPGDKRAQLRGQGEYVGSQYLLTENQPDYRNFGEWLGLPTSPAPAAQPLAPAAPAASATAKPGEFTRMFSVPAEPTVSAAPLPSAGPAPVPAEPPQGGEFTRMFSPPAATPQPAATPPPPSPRPEPSPGEFTRLFSTPAATPEPASPPAVGAAQKPITARASSASPAPGEFTRIFRSGLPESAENPLEKPSNLPPASGPELFQAAGEFTRIFGKPAGPTPGADSASAAPAPSVPAAAVPSQDPGEFTRLFGPSSAIGGPPPAPAPPTAPAPNAPLPVALPSLPKPQPLAAPQAAIPQPAAVAAPIAKKPSGPVPVPLIIFVGLILFVVFAVVLYFALRK